MSLHTTHPAIIKRLKRANGHLQHVIAMIEDERACVDIAQQLQAVESAVANAKTTLIRDHIDHCLERALAQSDGPAARASIDEFKAITRYL